jgi:ribosomal protein L11 methylase PrmA
MWLDHRSSELALDLRKALASAAAASMEDTHARLARRLAETARSSDRITRKAMLTDQSWLRAWLRTIDPHRIERMRTGYESALHAELYQLEESQS